ncbi:MAG: EAL domain-containing protein, partial [Gemmatimonadota bacterium]
MRNADRAMYRTRDRRDRNVAVYGEELQDDGDDGADGEPDAQAADDGSVDDAPSNDASGDAPSDEALRAALERGELVLHYQPIVRRLQEPAPGAEALLRWNHPDRGLRDASSFIEEARGGGLLPELDRWVLRQAVEQARRWSDTGVERWVSVNVSAETLAGRGLPGFLDDLVVESGLRRELLLIDATLSADAPRLEAAIPALRNLRAKGFRVALDYSGSADGLTSSFEGAPVDVVKVDRAVLEVLSPETVTELMGAAVVAK